jgi:hypothetical protein
MEFIQNLYIFTIQLGDYKIYFIKNLINIYTFKYGRKSIEIKIPQADEYSAVELCDVYSACSFCFLKLQTL